MHIKNLGVFTKAGNLLMSIDKKTVIREGIEPFHNITKWFKIAGFLKFRYSEKATKNLPTFLNLISNVKK